MQQIHKEVRDPLTSKGNKNPWWRAVKKHQEGLNQPTNETTVILSPAGPAAVHLNKRQGGWETRAAVPFTPTPTAPIKPLLFFTQPHPPEL